MEIGEAQFVAGVRSKRVVRGERAGNFTGQRLGQAPRAVDRGQFGQFRLGKAGQFFPFAREISGFGVGLARHRDIFARRHRH